MLLLWILLPYKATKHEHMLGLWPHTACVYVGEPEAEQYVQPTVQKEKFYTEGSPALKAARLQVLTTPGLALLRVHNVQGCTCWPYPQEACISSLTCFAADGLPMACMLRRLAASAEQQTTVLCDRGLQTAINPGLTERFLHR